MSDETVVNLSENACQRMCLSQRHVAQPVNDIRCFIRRGDRAIPQPLNVKRTGVGISVNIPTYEVADFESISSSDIVRSISLPRRQGYASNDNKKI